MKMDKLKLQQIIQQYLQKEADSQKELVDLLVEKGIMDEKSGEDQKVCIDEILKKADSSNDRTK